jgi:hypothetical protein
MEKKEIQTGLVKSYKSFTDYVSSLSEEEYMRAPEGKWTAGQQLDHLIRAVDPLAKGLLLPKFVVRLVFGKSNRPSKSYEDLVKKYKSKLEAGGKAAGRFVPSAISFGDKKKYSEKLLKKIGKLNNNINGYSETQLDTFILPHPLLGKITIREMMYFTIYHAEHHEGLVKKYSGHS